MTAARPLSILQFGKTGQVARALIEAAAAHPEISIRALGREDANLVYPFNVIRAFQSAGPVDVVVNAAAYTAVDKAESDALVAGQVNTESVAAMASECSDRGVPLIHISTDYVFDGSKPTPYVETDATAPLGVYGRTKLAGENAIRATTGNHVILRTSWVYSPWGTNFVKTMLRLGAERPELRVVDDQHGAPTSAASIAEAIFAVAPRLAAGGSTGTFHFCDAGETTWRRFAEAIFTDSASWSGAHPKVTPITTAEYPTPAERPRNSRLDCAKILHAYGVTRTPWRDALGRVLNELQAERSRP